MNKNKTTKSNQKDQRLINVKISVLQLAEELGNIQKACKATGIVLPVFMKSKGLMESLAEKAYVNQD